ncbi:MAG: hypothetical protein WCP97_07265 [bacterium]
MTRDSEREPKERNAIASELNARGLRKRRPPVKLKNITDCRILSLRPFRETIRFSEESPPKERNIGIVTNDHSGKTFAFAVVLDQQNTPSLRIAELHVDHGRIETIGWAVATPPTNTEQSLLETLGKHVGRNTPQASLSFWENQQYVLEDNSLFQFAKHLEKNLVNNNFTFTTYLLGLTPSRSVKMLMQINERTFAKFLSNNKINEYIQHIQTWHRMVTEELRQLPVSFENIFVSSITYPQQALVQQASQLLNQLEDSQRPETALLEPALKWTGRKASDEGCIVLIQQKRPDNTPKLIVHTGTIGGEDSTEFSALDVVAVLHLEERTSFLRNGELGQPVSSSRSSKSEEIRRFLDSTLGRDVTMQGVNQNFLVDLSLLTREKRVLVVRDSRNDTDCSPLILLENKQDKRLFLFEISSIAQTGEHDFTMFAREYDRENSWQNRRSHRVNLDNYRVLLPLTDFNNLVEQIRDAKERAAITRNLAGKTRRSSTTEYRPYHLLSSRERAELGYWSLLKRAARGELLPEQSSALTGLQKQLERREKNRKAAEAALKKGAVASALRISTTHDRALQETRDQQQQLKQHVQHQQRQQRISLDQAKTHLVDSIHRYAQGGRADLLLSVCEESVDEFSKSRDYGRQSKTLARYNESLARGKYLPGSWETEDAAAFLSAVMTRRLQSTDPIPLMRVTTRRENDSEAVSTIIDAKRDGDSLYLILLHYDGSFGVCRKNEIEAIQTSSNPVREFIDQLLFDIQRNLGLK